MDIPRRDFFKETAFGAALLTALGSSGKSAAGDAPPASKLRIGAPDWSLGKEGSPDAFASARDSWLQGVQVSCGRDQGGQLHICQAEHQKKLLEAAKETKLEIPSTCLEILHRDGLKDHPDAPKWVEQSIAPTAALGAKVILLPFFGGKAIKERAEQKAVAERLKPIAPAAEKAGVVLGLENTISAEDNAWIIDQVGSKALKVYYDVGNSTHEGFDVHKEIAWLGKDRICEIHLKDGSARLLGKGKIDMPRFVEGILKIAFEGWLVLETSPGPMKEDAAFVKGLIARS